MKPDTRRRSLLVAALAALRVIQSEPELAVVHQWHANRQALGHIVVGMERQGYALSLTKIADDGWRATFHSHPQLSAVQLPAWNALPRPQLQETGSRVCAGKGREPLGG